MSRHFFFLCSLLKLSNLLSIGDIWKLLTCGLKLHPVFFTFAKPSWSTLWDLTFKNRCSQGLQKTGQILLLQCHHALEWSGFLLSLGTLDQSHHKHSKSHFRTLVSKKASCTICHKVTFTWSQGMTYCLFKRRSDTFLQLSFYCLKFGEKCNAFFSSDSDRNKAFWWKLGFQGLTFAPTLQYLTI